MDKTLEFTINLAGNVYTGIASLDSAMKKLNITSEHTTSLFNKIGSKAISLDSMMNLARTAIDKVSGAIGKIVDVGSEAELQKLDMTTLMRGNEAAADALFKKIAQYGKDTVYDKTSLIDAQKTMMSFGIEGENAFSMLKKIGDVSLGDANKMKSLSLAFAQTSSSGKLTGQDLMQMINAGFNPLSVISEKTGKSMTTLKDEMSKGAISAEMVAQAFSWATEEGGLFYQGAEKAGNSTSGRINQLKDTFDEFLISLFEKLQPVINSCVEFAAGFLETLPGILSGIGSAFSGIWDFLTEFAPIITGVAVAIGILTIACNLQTASLMLQEAWLNILIAKEMAWNAITKVCAAAQAVLNAVMNANPIALIISGIVILIGVITWLCSKITGWGSLWDGVWGFIKNGFFAYISSIKLQWVTMINSIMMGLDNIKLGWYKFKEACGLGDSTENQAMINQINGDIEARKKAISDAAKEVADYALKAKDSLAGIKMGWKGKEETEEKQELIGTNDQMQNLVTNGNGTGGTKPTTTQNSSANVSTGGTRNTQITINLGKMIENIVFNGGYSENKQSMIREIEEAVARILYMATTTA